MGNFQKQPGGVAMQTALYNVRMLRPGYLYIRFMHKMYRAPVWRGYVVHPHGYLAQFDISQPQEAKPHPACEMEIRGANMSLVWIEEAKDVLEFHYMFHPDPVDLAHLKNEVEPQRDKYMQKFDVAGWANGSTGQKDTCQPGQLNGQVVEFAALGDAKLRDAMEPQLYGLMGANAIERVWGDWEDQVYEEKPGYTAMGDYAGGTLEARTEIRKGLPYATVHGPRLKQIAGYLQDKQGAIVACEDAVGMSQELGHLQTEAQVGYAHWQASQASDFVAGVSNEWVYQSAVGAQGLMELVKKGAMQRTEARIKDWNENYRPAPTLYPDAATQARELERRRRAVETNQQRERESPSRTADAQYASLFDNVAAANILDAQRLAYEKQQTMMAQLGADQRGWLLSKSLYRTMGAYSAQDAKIHMPGGGASLSLQLAQCLSGTEGNPTGRKLLESLDLWGDNPLSRMLCFNSLTLQNTLKEVEAAQPPETTQPGAEASTPLADWVSEKIKPQAGRFGLGDKALGFTQEVPALADSQRLRKLAWPLHVASLMSVKMMQTVNALPVTKWEAQI
ncbi:MAG: hypothetical protein JSR41_11135, partial [Proteobacteria bacterium]|nr:hypothetical protein [Pseudomonadota bacterium]